MKQIDKCPVCFSKPLLVVRKKINYCKVNGIVKELYEEYYLNLTKEPEPQEILGICAKCNTVYRAKFFNEEEITKIYSSIYFNIEEKLSDYEGFVYNNAAFKEGCSKKMFHYVKRIEKKYKVNIKTIFDIGGRDGFRLYDLAENGYDCKIFDPIKCEACNNKIIKQNLWSYQIGKDEKADLIILCNVLEHCIDLHKIINDCYKHLNKGGFIFVEVPCDIQTFFDWLLFYRIFNENLNIDITHHVFFSQRSIKYLIHDEGITVLESAIGKLPQIDAKVIEITGRKISGTRPPNNIKGNLGFLYMIIGWLIHSLKRVGKSFIM